MKYRRLLLAAALLSGGAAAQQEAPELLPRQDAALQELFAAFGDESLPLLNAAVKTKMKAKIAALLQADESLPSWGEGPAVVEFSDYQCVYCKRMFALLQAAGARVRVVELPIFGELSKQAARYALAAAKQNRYAEFHTLLMAHGEPLNAEILETAVAEAGLDRQQLLADSDSEEIKQAIERNYQTARLLGLRGTPFFIIGNTLAEGAINAETLQELLAKQ